MELRHFQYLQYIFAGTPGTPAVTSRAIKIFLHTCNWSIVHIHVVGFANEVPGKSIYHTPEGCPVLPQPVLSYPRMSSILGIILGSQAVLGYQDIPSDPGMSSVSQTGILQDIPGDPGMSLVS